MNVRRKNESCMGSASATRPVTTVARAAPISRQAIFKIKHIRALRIAVAMGMFLILVVLSGLAFYFLRQIAPDGSPLKYAYIFFGPTLSLFTHMSYIMFGLQSLMLFPWLLLGALRPPAVLLCVVAFGLTWLSLGWYMYGLF
jgi:hypothetical protein